MSRIFLAGLLTFAFAYPIAHAEDLTNLSREQALAQGMFIPVGIVLDTTKAEDLQAATKLQELLFRLNGERVPLVDRQYSKEPWNYIHIAWDHTPQVPREPRFMVQMKMPAPDEWNPNPPQKQLIISGAAPATIEQAVSAFTTAAFGVPLSALESKDFKWPSRKLLAIPKVFGTVHVNRLALPDRTRAKLVALFKKYYPNAPIVDRRENGWSVEFEVKDFEIPYTGAAALKQKSYTQKGPTPGGILCTINSSAGTYQGQIVLFSDSDIERDIPHTTFDRKEFKQLLMAPIRPRATNTCGPPCPIRPTRARVLKRIRRDHAGIRNPQVDFAATARQQTEIQTDSELKPLMNANS